MALPIRRARPIWTRCGCGNWRKKTFPLPSLLTSLIFLLAEVATPIVAATDYNSTKCDETKCRAPYPFPKESTTDSISYQFYSFTDGFCWASGRENVEDPSNCADGYEPRHVEGTNTIPGYEGDDYAYFTCCPPDYEEENTTTQCDSTFQACDSAFVDCSGFVGFGIFDAITCAKNGRFKYPNFVIQEGNFILYSCCETDDGSLPQPYTQNTAFNLTLYPQLVLSVLVLLFLLLLVASILSSQDVRKESYNLYIIFLAIPDVFYNLGIVTIYSLVIGNFERQISNTHLFLGAVCWLANMWINTIICFEVKKMVICTHRMMRSDPPTPKRVCQQCSVVYLFSLLLSGLVIFGPGAVSTAGTFALLPCAVIPFGYIPYATYRVWKTGMLQQMSATGRSKSLSIYFGRIILVFFGFSIPTVALAAITGMLKYHPDSSIWTNAVGTYLITLQGAVSAAMALTKPDIRRCWNDSWESRGSMIGLTRGNTGSAT